MAGGADRSFQRSFQTLLVLPVSPFLSPLQGVRPPGSSGFAPRPYLDEMERLGSLKRGLLLVVQTSETPEVATTYPPPPEKNLQT